MFNHFFARAVLFSEQSKGLNLFRFVHEYTCNRFWQPALKHYLPAPQQKKRRCTSLFVDGFIVFVLPCQFSMRSSVVLQTLTWLQKTVRWIKFKWNYTYENINSIWKRWGERGRERNVTKYSYLIVNVCALWGNNYERNDTVTDRKRQIFGTFEHTPATSNAPTREEKNRTHIGASIQARHKCRVYKCACDWNFFLFHFVSNSVDQRAN